MNLQTAEIDISEKRRRIELNERRGHRDFPGEVVVGDVEEPERGLIERGNGAAELIVLQVQNVEPTEIEQRRRNDAGDVVAGEDNDFQAVEG